MCIEIGRCGVLIMRSSEGFAIRQEAIEALEKSTKMFEVALELATQGNQAEAERLRKEARTQRTISEFLQTEANNLEGGILTRAQTRGFSASRKYVTRINTEH